MTDVSEEPEARSSRAANRTLAGAAALAWGWAGAAWGRRQTEGDKARRKSQLGGQHPRHVHRVTVPPFLLALVCQSRGCHGEGMVARRDRGTSSPEAYLGEGSECHSHGDAGGRRRHRRAVKDLGKRWVTRAGCRSGRVCWCSVLAEVACEGVGTEGWRAPRSEGDLWLKVTKAWAKIPDLRKEDRVMSCCSLVCTGRQCRLRPRALFTARNASDLISRRSKLDASGARPASLLQENSHLCLTSSTQLMDEGQDSRI